MVILLYMNKKQQTPILVMLYDIWDQLRPPLTQRLFIQAVGSWWLRLKGYKYNAMVSVYRLDFVSERKKQIVVIEHTPKKDADIVRLQEHEDFITRRDERLYKKGWSVFYVMDIDIYNSPDEVRRVIRKWSKDPVGFTAEVRR